MLQNPFFVIRYVCFSLILFLNLLSLIFATWNVAAIKSVQRSAPGASVLLLFNGVAIFISIMIALAELVVVKAKTAKVKFECTWTAIMAILQLAAALTTTATGPPFFCQLSGPSQACISVSVLVPLSWLSTFTVVCYFLTLTVTTIIYAPCYPDIWGMSVSAVPWFIFREPPPMVQRKASTTTSSSRTLRGSPPHRARGIWDDDIKDDEVESIRVPSCASLPVAPWAKPFLTNKRGFDRPFATRSQVIAANPELPVPPPKSKTLPIASRYMGLSGKPWGENKGDGAARTLSQWVQDDAAQGRTVHSNPPITPF